MAKVPAPRISLAGIRTLASHINTGRVIGAVGSSVPLMDAGVLAFIKKYGKKPVGVGAKQGMKYVGGPVAVGTWAYMGYTNRHLVPQAVDQYSRLWDSFKSSDIHKPHRIGDPERSGGRSRNRTTSRKRDGPPSLSQRTRRSPSFGKRRRRCKHRNKAGKQCLRPAGHSGRHRYS